jgi:hypothetical protein
MAGIGGKQTPFSPTEIQFVHKMRNGGYTFTEIHKEFTKKFKRHSSPGSLSNLYNKTKLYAELGTSEADALTVRNLYSARRTGAKNNRNAKVLAEYLDSRQDLLDEIHEFVKTIKFPKFAPSKRTVLKNKPKMTAELMISDVHVGKKTEQFNLAVCNKRIQQLSDVFIEDIKHQQAAFNVERIILAFIGDIIENDIMHGVESVVGCEFSNSRQVVEAVKVFFKHLITPLAHLNIPMFVPCVTGNHDRPTPDKTYHKRGEQHLTFIIYTMLEMMCTQAGYKHIKFEISRDNHVLGEIYGDHILWEHFDLLRSFNLKGLENHLRDRQNQLGVIIQFMRGGHYHQYLCSGRGRIIVNESVCGSDDYSDALGFDSHSGQTINYYIKNKTRPNSFYKSFPVYLN